MSTPIRDELKPAEDGGLFESRALRMKALRSSLRPGGRPQLTWREFHELPDEAVVRREDVAALLAISPRQVARLGLPVVRCGDIKCVRFPVGGIRKWLAAQQGAVP